MIYEVKIDNVNVRLHLVENWFSSRKEAVDSP